MAVPTTPVVSARALTRTFTVPEREPGVRNAVRSLVRRRHRIVRAVEAVEFDIAASEIGRPSGASLTHPGKPVGRF